MRQPKPSHTHAQTRVRIDKHWRASRRSQASQARVPVPSRRFERPASGASIHVTSKGGAHVGVLLSSLTEARPELSSALQASIPFKRLAIACAARRSCSACTRMSLQLSPQARGRRWVEPILREACSRAYPESAICVQRFDDSLNSAIRITYRISLRSSSLREPRYPLLRVVQHYVYLSGDKAEPHNVQNTR
jgi:hypothetical protein